MSEQSQPYPGDNATVEELFSLAEEYWKAAGVLKGTCRRGNPISHAPYRMVAIHAVELYLNALLRFQGLTPPDIRKMNHNLVERLGRACTTKLKLRNRTAAHIAVMSDCREYLVSRYGPDKMKNLSQLNRLEATLEQIRKEVHKLIGAAKPRAAAEECTTAKSSAVAMPP
jgi:hypothetical protein